MVHAYSLTQRKAYKYIPVMLGSTGPVLQGRNWLLWGSEVRDSIPDDKRRLHGEGNI